MSSTKKYVPSFLKGQGQTGGTTISHNRFAALDENDSQPNELVNTSLPAKEAPILKPATLASLTSNGSTSSIGSIVNTFGNDMSSTKSYGAKFAEAQKIIDDPEYKPPPKPLNIQSEDDFPTLGGAKSKTVPTKKKAVVVSEIIDSPVKKNFADLARDWAVKQAEDDEVERARVQMEEDMKKLAIDKRQHYMRRQNGPRFRRRVHNEDGENDDEDDNEENDYNDDDEYDSYSSVSEGEGSVEFENEDEDDQHAAGEYNSNMGRQRRHNEDLY